jgi:hypothetical protein
MKKNCIRCALAGALAATSGAGFALDEMEPNDSISTAQRLVIGNTGEVQVAGALGVLTWTTAPVADVDFYSFHGQAGDVVSIDLDNGVKPNGSSVRSMDSVVAVFGPDRAVLRQNDDGGTLDPGSISGRDSRLTNVQLPVTGIYTVGVSSYPRLFIHGGGLTSTILNASSNGSYTVVISGVTPSVEQMAIDIKPGATHLAPVNPKSKGNIPVALLSSAQFDATKVDRSSLTFGASGDEPSLRRCGKEGEDVNRDGRPDLVCHFDTQIAGFEPGDDEGIVRGTREGTPFEGRGWLKVVPAKRDE